MKKIEVGQIWKVKSDFFLGTPYLKVPEKVNRPVKVFRDEFIEIRFPFAWHFRTEDGSYFHATPEDIHEHCEYYADIEPFVQRKNRAGLKDIIRLELYTKGKENEQNI